MIWNMEKYINSGSKAVENKKPGFTFLTKFLSRKREEIFADVLIGTLVITAVCVIFLNII